MSNTDCLHKEALKSWDHFQTDEIIYLSDAFTGFGDSRSIPAETYRNGSGWLELQFMLHGERDAYYKAIISRVNSECSASVISGGHEREISIKNAAIGRNSPVLVEVTHLVQPPQRVIFIGCPSMIWLKRFNFTEGFRGGSDNLLFESLKAINCGHLDNRELCATGNSVKPCEAPDELIKSGAHVVESISDNQTNFRGNIHQMQAEDVSLIFYFVLTNKSVGIRRRAEGPEFGIQSVKMFLRPTDFQFGLVYSRHDEGK